jgi:Arm DNA-binding domain
MSEALLLTDKAIARLPYAEAGQYKVRDVELKGFFLRIGKRTKTYMVQGEHWRDGFREFSTQKKLGDFGTISARDARTKAKEALGSFAKGERPGFPMRVNAGYITRDKLVRGHLRRQQERISKLILAGLDLMIGAQLVR